jgi:hypothetical protein
VTRSGARRGRSWRTGAAVLLAAIGTQVLPVAAGGGRACAAEPVQIRIAVVVDFGGDPGAPTAPVRTCVAVPDGATGADVLQARARQLGTPAPRYDSNGLLCANDGHPESGCGERTADGYRYWSYWQGGERWAYANVGPAGHRLHDGAVEGWRFLDGTGSGRPGDDPPRASARFADTCAAATTTAVTAPATTAAPPTAAPQGAVTTVVATSTAPVATTPNPGSTLVTAPPTRSAASTGTGADDTGEAAATNAASPGAGDTGDDGGGVPLGLVAGLGLVGVVGAGAVAQARRRPRQ